MRKLVDADAQGSAKVAGGRRSSSRSCCGPTTSSPAAGL